MYKSRLARVLVTDGGQKHTLGLVRHLGMHNVEVDVLSFRRGSICSHSKYCQDEYIIDYSDPFLLERLSSILQKKKYDLLIPVGTESVKICSKYKNYIEVYTDIICVDQEKLGVALSKEKTLKFADSLGIRVPRTFYPRSIEDAPSGVDVVGTPVVIKARQELGISVVDYAHSFDEFVSKYRSMCDLHGFNKENLPLVQEYIHGTGYGFFALYDNGKLVNFFQHRRRREYPASGGMSVAAESSRRVDVFNNGRKLLDALEWHGIAMVEFRATQSGDIYLMEINPKYWGSLDLCLEAGVNFPLNMLQMAKSVPVERSEYRYPFKYHWPLHGDILLALSAPSQALDVLKDIFDPSVKSNIWVRDDIAGTLGFLPDLALKLWRKFIA